MLNDPAGGFGLSMAAAWYMESGPGWAAAHLAGSGHECARRATLNTLISPNSRGMAPLDNRFLVHRR
jgi:hypothetical protein